MLAHSKSLRIGLIHASFRSVLSWFSWRVRLCSPVSFISSFRELLEMMIMCPVVTLASLICYVMQTSLLFVMINMVCRIMFGTCHIITKLNVLKAVPIVGICFCSIVVSVGGNVDDRSGEYSSATFGSIPRFRQADRVYALSPMTARTSKTSLHDDNVASQLP